MTTSGGAAAKTPWYKKWWIWAIVAAVIVIGVIGNLVGGSDEAAAPTVSATAPDPVETIEPDVTEEPTGPTDEERAATLDTAIRDSMGGQEYSEIFASDPSLWAGWISGVRVEGGNAFITLQVGADEPEWGDLGTRAASALSTLLPADAVDGISWIIVEDASGAVIDQQRPSPLS